MTLYLTALIVVTLLILAMALARAASDADDAIEAWRRRREGR